MNEYVEDQQLVGKTVAKVIYLDHVEPVLLRFTDGDYAKLAVYTSRYGEREVIFSELDDADLLQLGVIDNEEYQARLAQVMNQCQERTKEQRRQQWEQLKRELGS